MKVSLDELRRSAGASGPRATMLAAIDAVAARQGEDLAEIAAVLFGAYITLDVTPADLHAAREPAPRRAARAVVARDLAMEHAMTNWKIYSPIEAVAVYDAAQLADTSTDVQVTARVSGADLDTPIGVVVRGACSLALTLEQTDALIEQLGRARADVTRALVARRAGGMQQ